MVIRAKLHCSAFHYTELLHSSIHPSYTPSPSTYNLDWKWLLLVASTLRGLTTKIYIPFGATVFCYTALHNSALHSTDYSSDLQQTSSPRNFCNIPDYIDGMVMYEYIAILCNFKGSPPVQTTPNQYS